MHTHVRFANIYVMKSNIDSGAPPPPSEQTAVQAAAPEILAMDSGALESHLQGLLGRAGFNRQPPRAAADGSPQISSLLAVWLVSQIGHAVGRPKLINLSRVKNKDSLKSLRGVARLLDEAIADQRPVRKAS